jgi:hypothetical protein
MLAHLLALRLHPFAILALVHHRDRNFLVELTLQPRTL